MLVLKTDIPISKAVQLIKGGSSKWLREKFKEMNMFAWQTGYGVFTVSQSQMPILVRYIRNQKEHHRQIDFLEEYKNFLAKNGISYDPKYLL